MKFFVFCLALLSAGCLQKLPPHVWIPIQDVQIVERRWSPETQTCELRIVRHEIATDRWVSILTPVDMKICEGK